MRASGVNAGASVGVVEAVVIVRVCSVCVGMVSGVNVMDSVAMGVNVGVVVRATAATGVATIGFFLRAERFALEV